MMENESEYRTMEAYCIMKRICFEEGVANHISMAVLLDYKSVCELADKWDRSSIDVVFDVRDIWLVWRESSCPYCGETLPPLADELAFNCCPYCASRMVEDDEAV